MSTSVEDRQAYDLLPDYAPSRPSGLPPAEGVPRMVALQLAAMAASSIALAYLMIRFSTILESLGSWGYAGVAAAEFSNSAMIIVPTPALAYTFAMGAILNPFILGLIGGTFGTMGEFVGYALGRRGAVLIPDRPMVQRVTEWADRWGAIVLFCSASLPVPFDIAGIWAGTVRYPLERFIPLVWAGKTLNLTLVALAGYYGVEALVRLFG